MHGKGIKETMTMADLMLDLRALSDDQREELVRDLEKIMDAQQAREKLTYNLLPFVNRVIRVVDEARARGWETVEMAVLESGAVALEHVRSHPDYMREMAELQRKLKAYLVFYPGVTRSVGGVLRPDARVRAYLLPVWQVPPVSEWGREATL